MAQGADIIAIQKTWKSSEQIASMHTGDYVLYAQSRIGKGGGVAVLVRTTLRSKRIPLTIPQHDTSLEVVVVQVALDQNRDLIVASAYMRTPPQVTQSFRRLVNCLPASTPLLLCGDFNMHHPQWEPFLESSPSEVAAEFLELCTDAGLTLVNTPGEITYARGTRERSCIDLTWSKHLTVSDWSASVSPLSDHYMLTFTLHQAFKDTIPSAPKFFYSWGKCKWDSFIKDFDAQLPAYDYKKQSTGIKAFTRALITSYRRHCPRGMHKDGPRLWDDTLMEAEWMATDSKARYLQLPTPDREAEMQRTRSQFFLLLRERLRNTYLRRIGKLNPGEPLAWKYISGRKKASLPSPTSILLGDGQHTYKTARRAANALNRIFLPYHPSHKAVRFSKGINRQSASLNINASFLFGQQNSNESAASFTSFSSTSSSSEPQNNNESAATSSLVSSTSLISCISEPQNNDESAATFNSGSSLSSSSEPQDKNEAATTSGLVAHLHSPLDAPFNRTELLAALRNTPYGKAPGPDEVYSEALRHISSKGLRFLLRCINHSWTTGTIPVEWRRATIVPLLKPGKSPELLESYRPISLTSIVSKVAEKMVLKRLLWVWTPHPHQYAYRSMRTTTMQLAHLIHEVEHNRNHYFQVSLPKKSGIGNQLHYRPHRTLLVLVDFSKAFDSIDHRVLSRLLANIPGVNCRRWLRNFLCGRYAKTRVGHRNSDRRPMLRGVPQGSVLGPYLFSLYVHPLLNLLNSFAGVTADMYADDLSIIVKGQSREDAIPTANMVLQKLHAWSQENGLAINPSKCEAAWFTLSTHTESDYDREGRWPLVVAGCQIPVMTMGASRTTKLLGMDLDPRLTLNVAATKQCAATSQRISQLRCIAHKEAGPSPHDLRTFVIGYGASKLRYGSELIWAVATDPAKNEMQKTYATLARIVSGVPSTVDPESALLEANMPPLHVLCLRARLSIFENTRACQMDWMRRPPPEPPPRAGFRISPLSRDELYAFVDAYTKDYGITQSSPREERFFRSSIPPWFAASAHRVTIGVELPIDHSITDEEELIREKRRVSEEALALHSHRSWILATDGGVDVPKSAGVGILLSSLNSSEIIEKDSINCGARPCSYRTESRALLLALEKLMIPRIRHRRKTLLVVTDSQSLLAALNKGPLSQTDWTEDQIWQRLLTLTCAGLSVHLQFCYGHCGVHANELADQYATQTMESGQYTEQGIAPLWHTDLLTCFTTQLTNKWRSTIRQDTHRYLLCGTRPSDLSGKDLITQEVLHRQELVHLARARCGESELWGRLYWAVRDCTNQCRFCNISPEQSAYMRSNNDPTAPGTDTVPPSAREEDVSPARRRTLTRRRKEKCPHCDSTLTGFSNLVSHCRSFHPEHPPPLPELKCDFCGKVFPTRRSTAQHRNRCAQNPDATRHRNSSARRRSLLPQDQPASSSTPIGPQETLHHLLLECPGTLAVRQRLGIEQDLRLGKFSQWQLLHSRKLLSLLDHLFGTQMALYS
ncbi:putative trans-sialidase [Trypanosoma cruzi]|uniref:Putative trans-sialidase n=1 Tax=Trypanosoma cruzi TaxID=5693 RepID=A0A2V2UYZ3_TRYCR|nr:putative trans-sialidase [Trypanosoma cruzi]